VQAFHAVVAELATLDKQLTVKNIHRVKTRKVHKLQHNFYQKSGKFESGYFLSPLRKTKKFDIVQSGINSFGSAWVEAVSKTAAFVIAPLEI